MIRTAMVALAFVAATAATAAAEPRSQDVRVTVRTADIDASTERGAKKILRRLERAAYRACNPASSHFISVDRADADRCKADALNAAVASLDQPMVTALYNERTGRRTVLASTR